MQLTNTNTNTNCELRGCLYEPSYPGWSVSRKFPEPQNEILINFMQDSFTSKLPIGKPIGPLQIYFMEVLKPHQDPNKMSQASPWDLYF